MSNLIDRDALLEVLKIDAEFDEKYANRLLGEGAKEIADIIRASYENAVKNMPTIDPVKWIPVSEGLPEEGWCLCTVHGVFYDYCEILSCQKRKRKMRFLRLDDDGEYVDFTDWVTAWMPLPEPWRGEEDE